VRVLAEHLHDLLGPEHGGENLGPVDARRAGGDTVVGGRVALGEYETLAAASGAAVPVGVLGSAAIVKFDNRFSDNSLYIGQGVKPLL
jgi:hypothetical protein